MIVPSHPFPIICPSIECNMFCALFAIAGTARTGFIIVVVLHDIISCQHSQLCPLQHASEISITWVHEIDGSELGLIPYSMTRHKHTYMSAAHVIRF